MSFSDTNYKLLNVIILLKFLNISLKDCSVKHVRSSKLIIARFYLRKIDNDRYYTLICNFFLSYLFGLKY